MTKYLQKIKDSNIEGIVLVAYLTHDNTVKILKQEQDFLQGEYNEFFINQNNTDATKLENEIINIFKRNKSRQVIIVSNSEKILEFCKTERGMLPILDDMAQVVGMSLKLVNERKSYWKQLRWQNCLLLGKGTLLAVGRTLEEGIVATQVAEKAVNCYLEAKKLGGAKPINAIRSAIMYVVYKNKYSKANIKRQKEQNR